MGHLRVYTSGKRVQNLKMHRFVGGSGLQQQAYEHRFSPFFGLSDKLTLTFKIFPVSNMCKCTYQRRTEQSRGPHNSNVSGNTCTLSIVTNLVSVLNKARSASVRTQSVNVRSCVYLVLPETPNAPSAWVRRIKISTPPHWTCLTETSWNNLLVGSLSQYTNYTVR